MAEDTKMKVKEIAQAVRDELLNDDRFWDRVGEAWFKRYKKADEDLEL